MHHSEWRPDGQASSYNGHRLHLTNRVLLNLLLQFVGAPVPCGVVITRARYIEALSTNVEYLNSRDATIMGSRNGHAPIYLWYTLTKKGYEGMRKDVEKCLRNAHLLKVNCDLSSRGGAFFQMCHRHAEKRNPARIVVNPCNSMTPPAHCTIGCFSQHGLLSASLYRDAASVL